MNAPNWPAVLEREGSAFAALLDPPALAVPVRSCPGWSLADLARHLGGIHRWARHAILHGPSDEPEGPADDSAVRGWYEQGLEDLLRTLRSCDGELPCWTFADPPMVRFWMRRQAHETTLHRWDAASSLGRAVTIPEPLAEDGIDEVLTMFLPRQVRLNRLPPGPELVELVCDSGRRLTLATTGADTLRAPDATVSGTAESLLLLLWRRIALTDPRLEVTGTRSTVEDVLLRPLTP